MFEVDAYVFPHAFDVKNLRQFYTQHFILRFNEKVFRIAFHLTFTAVMFDKPVFGLLRSL